MANIANLSVQLTLQTANFQKKLTTSQQSMVSMSKTVGALGKSIIGLGVALGAGLAAGLAAAAKQGADFEESIVRVGSIVDATEVQLANLARTARDFGESTVFSAVQSAEAMREFSQAGFSVDQTLKALSPTLNFAIAGMLTISEAADVAARVMFSMGQEAEDLSDSLEVLTKAFTLAPVSVMELGEAFKFVGPVGRAAGKDIQELTSFLVVFARAGLRGEQAGTALRNILLRLQAQPSEVKKALQSLNVTIEDSEGNMRALVDILEDVRLATVNMSAVQRQATISQIAGIRATAAFSAAMNTGAESIREIERELRINSGTMDRLAKNQLTTLTSRVLLLKSALVELGITINDVFGADIKTGIDNVTDFAKGLSDLAQENEKLTKGLIKGAAAVAALLVVVGSIITALAGGMVVWIAWKIAIGVGAVAAMKTFVIGAVALVGSLAGMVAVLALAGTALAVTASGLNEAKGELFVLNKETENAIALQTALARTQTNMITLFKERQKAISGGNILGQMRAELALVKQQQEATAIRLARAKELIQVRQRLGQPTGFDQRSIANLNTEMRQLVELEKNLTTEVANAAEAQKQLTAERAMASQLRQKAILEESIGLKLTKDRMNAFALTNTTLAKTLEIQRQATSAEALFAAMIAKSNLTLVQREILMSNVRDSIEATTRIQMAALQQTNAMIVASFLANEQEKAAIQLAGQKQRALQAVKGLKDEAKLRLAIEKKFQLEAGELKKQFGDDADTGAAPSGPGALIAGTVEAFKAAFKANPALEESRKQTKEQKSISRAVKGILRNTAGLAEANQGNQIVIAE